MTKSNAPFFTSDEICEAAGCLPGSLRIWRHRNGLLPDVRNNKPARWMDHKSIPYSLANGLAVCVVKLLVDKGVSSQDAVNVANTLREQFEEIAAGKTVDYIAFSSRAGMTEEDREGLEYKVFDETSLVIDAIGDLNGSVVTILNMNAVHGYLIFKLRELRGNL